MPAELAVCPACNREAPAGEMRLPCPDCGRLIAATLDQCPACGERLLHADTLAPEEFDQKWGRRRRLGRWSGFTKVAMVAALAIPLLWPTVNGSLLLGVVWAVLYGVLYLLRREERRWLELVRAAGGGDPGGELLPAAPAPWKNYAIGLAALAYCVAVSLYVGSRPPPPDEERLPARAEAAGDRLGAIQRLVNAGMFVRIAGLGGGTIKITVGDPFYQLPLEGREGLVRMVADYANERLTNKKPVILLDARSNQEVGRYQPGEGLKMGK